MSTLALFFETDQVENPSHPSLLSASLLVEASLAYSSVAALPAAFRSLIKAGSVANSSAEARISSSVWKGVSSLSPRKKLAAVVLRIPSLVSFRDPYHHRP